MKWFITIVAAAIATILIVAVFCIIDSLMVKTVAIWAEAGAALSPFQQVLVSVWMITKRFSLLIGLLIFPICLTASLIIAARKKQGDALIRATLSKNGN